MAVGIDKTENEFSVTSQIAIPQSSKQGKSTQTVQIEGKGKTVADAFSVINAKTGWYPKLVFCRLIILGEDTAKEDVFQALYFFLLDEYMSDNCLLATCDGKAKELLNASALIDPSGSIAMQKVLSPHAERVGEVLTATLREFAISYNGAAKAGYMPILKKEQQQEKAKQQTSKPAASGGAEQGSSAQSGGSGEEKTEDKPVFSAGETALFVGGVRVGKLNRQETFAFSAVQNELKLASYSVERERDACTLSIKNNLRKKSFSVAKDGKATLTITLTVTAGILDYNTPTQPADAGDVPEGVLPLAAQMLAGQVQTAFQKCQKFGCDLFELTSLLQKREHKRFEALQDEIVKNASLAIHVTFQNVR